MNEQELKEIEARVDPFYAGEMNGKWVEDTDENGDEWIRIPGGHDVKFWNIEGSSGCCYAVTHFIAHARQDVPALCEEVRRLNGELAMAMDAVDELSRQMAEIERLRAALDKIMHELGVPQPRYLAPVANAYYIAEEALKGGEG